MMDAMFRRLVMLAGALLLLSGCGGVPTPLPTTTFQFTGDMLTREPAVTPSVGPAISTTPDVAATGAPAAPGGDGKEALATAKAGTVDLPQSPPATPPAPAGPTPTPVPLVPLPRPELRPVTSLARPADPVVLTGADVPAFLGLPPGDLVAWRWSENGWQQIPLQVDERTIVDLRAVNGRTDASAPVFLFYTDPAVYPDGDPALDEDDEIVFMAQDAGLELTPATTPPGVVAGSALQVTITDPLDPAVVGYVYLFQQDGSLDPGAGQQYVRYAFNPLAVAVPDPTKQNSTEAAGPRTEDSVVMTPYYGHHFSARWILDELHFFPDDSGDLIDRFRNQLTPNDCDRSENSFSAAEGFFVVNKSGPVRAIRSYIGANSGVYTQRLHLFYAQRQDIVTYVRVHAVPGVVDFVDYNENALGMTYANNLNPAGVLIDGEPEEMPPGALEWELASGDQGSLVMLHQVDTTIPEVNWTNYYQDATNPAQVQCAGDRHAYGSSGPFLHPLPCTDPARAVVDPQNCPVPYHLALTRIIYYETPNLPVEAAQQYYTQWQTPLQYRLEPAG
ncbi:MAG: hypothetical protein L0332_03380 [Chloroflexi bacterium]|nr:hypothetical protein [Chloroflexota bacterium]MCI0579662.1 hypothetical protein [Chloroflexota bacterium]MCI0645898.1 hypothetical protein [Chloroflexota bacterium]MCI0725753.1 hypothetical protein [Chloroflexota bacterium]